MYSRCTFCYAPLGRNDVLEPFPVGRRIAFDPGRGRLWAICRACRAWNLAPLEERWEAVEAAERLFRDAPAGALGAITSNIALARLTDDTELVRVGRARLPELAAWRYGRRLLRRRMIYQYVGGAVGGGLSLAGLGPVGLAGAGALYMAWLHLRDRQQVARTAAGEVVRRGDATRALLVPAPDDAGGVRPWSETGWRLEVRRRGGRLVLEGDEALRALRRFLPRVNVDHWEDEELQYAVMDIQRAGVAERLIRDVAARLASDAAMDPRRTRLRRPWPHRIATAAPVHSLALEICANEAAERRALEGELDQLEREWREAEELAAIADDLLFPAHLREHLDAIRRRDSGRTRRGSPPADDPH